MNSEKTVVLQEMDGNIPILNLTNEIPVPAVEPALVAPAKMEDVLGPDEKAAVAEFAKKIDITDAAVIMQYGAATQKRMTSFSEGALSSVKTRDLGEIGTMVSGLASNLTSLNEKKGVLGFFKKAANDAKALRNRYDTAEKNVERITGALEKHQTSLMRDVVMLDEMYEQNVLYYKELTMYILAGKQKLEEVRANELVEAQAKAKKTGLPEDAQAANDLVNQCERFERKLNDLTLTRTISVQMAPQIRVVQNNDTVMAEKIQSTLVNAIPLWKNQMVLSLGLAHSAEAAKAQKSVSDATNNLLKQNSETLKTTAIETARESERGIVDVETLQETNRNLIATLDEVVKIQAEGRQKRAEAEVELGRIEGELKNRLLALKNAEPVPA